jgi:hypothetical protein
LIFFVKRYYSKISILTSFYGGKNAIAPPWGNNSLARIVAGVRNGKLIDEFPQA